VSAASKVEKKLFSSNPTLVPNTNRIIRLGCAGNMTFIRRQTEGSDGIHMTKEDKDLVSEESEKMYVHAVLEQKERSHRVCISLSTSDSQEQLAAL